VSVDRSSDELRAARGLAAADARTVTTRAAQRANLTLGAGTQAALQPDTRLTTPADFGPRLRVAALDGAAMFTVAPGGGRPMEVRAGRATVRTAGGEVAVRAYRDEPTGAVLVRSGTATVRTAGGSERLDAGRAVLVGADGRITPLDGGARDAAVGWTAGRFAVVDRPVRELLPALRRWFDLEVSTPTPAMLDRRVTLRAPLGSARAVLAALDTSAGLPVETQGGRMVFRERRP
jgi:transmembrane sensor